MPKQLTLGDEIILVRPAARRPLSGSLMILAALLSVCGGVWAWQNGYRPPFLSSQGSATNLEFVEVGMGDVIEYVVENGTLESANNTQVRCEVEALMGMVGGTSGAGGAAGSTTSGTTSSSGSAQSGSGSSAAQGGSDASGGSGSGGGSSTKASAKAKSKAGTSKKSSASSGSSSGSSGGSGSSGSGSSSGSGGMSGSGGSSGSSSTASSGTSGDVRKKADHSQLHLHSRAAHSAAWRQHQEHDDDRGEIESRFDWRRRWWRRRRTRWRRQRRQGWRQRGPGRWRWHDGRRETRIDKDRHHPSGGD